ncbi:MAG: class II glutamine amidotransferase [Myxococcales bacterium]|nr:class II glutamine amidotransferase [Myxococcales bacterium]
MCRLFAFRSIIPSQVHRSLVAADNALCEQSNRHPDGWGVAYYVDGAPHVTRSPGAAHNDQLFHRLSGVVSSDTVLAHVRRATVGPKTVLNCHPFQYGKWVFAHNGDVTRFAEHREALVREIAPRLRRFILGETDSEVVFFLFLTELEGYGPLASRHGVEDVMQALRTATLRVRAICDRPGEVSVLTVITTDGATLVASRGGRELYWSTHKVRCSDRENCAHLAPHCEAPSTSGFVNHLLFSSERIASENVWQPLEDGDLMGVDWRMRLCHSRHERRALPLADAADANAPAPPAARGS